MRALNISTQAAMVFMPGRYPFASSFSPSTGVGIPVTLIVSTDPVLRRNGGTICVSRSRYQQLVSSILSGELDYQ
jgi:hypothetical protein